MNYKDKSDLYDLCESRAGGAGDKHTWIHSPTITGLCNGCTHSLIYRRESVNEVKVHCNKMADFAPVQVPEDINMCSGYNSRSEISLHAMIDVATIINIDKIGTVGFKSPWEDTDE